MPRTPLGDIWEGFGCPSDGLGSPCDLSEVTWGRLGSSWGRLGPSLGHLGPSLGRLERSRGRLGRSLGCFGRPGRDDCHHLPRLCTEIDGPRDPGRLREHGLAVVNPRILAPLSNNILA